VGTAARARRRDVLAIPANWPASPSPAGERHVLLVNVQAAAYTNRVFAAVADRCGDERGVGWFGGGLIVGPDGYPLAGPAPGDGPAVVLADCDLSRARDRTLGPRNDVHADRRPDLYALAPGASPVSGTGEIFRPRFAG
jgi:5-aminopentanamidase